MTIKLDFFQALYSVVEDIEVQSRIAHNHIFTVWQMVSSLLCEACIFA